jgi:glycosyltransferase involved in cell wall biosynthesis
VSTHYLLDLSRLLSKAGRPTPTGIDRVELAYARHLIAADRDSVSFTATTFDGRLAPLPSGAAVRLVAALDAHWRGGAGSERAGAAAKALGAYLRPRLFLAGERALFRRERRAGRDIVYLLVSHHHLDRPATIRRLKEQTGARFICLVHDLIPMEFPEYARPGQAERHRRRIETVALLADAVIVNSASTGLAFRGFLDRASQAPAILVAPLGIEAAGTEPPRPLDRDHPYFICVGTIEPKKNHLLLLNVWRGLANEFGAGAPRLVLVGQRGWENENVVDMIERSIPLRGLVEEYDNLQDSAMRRYLVGARALLMPSFAEGYGLPVAEAMASGVPVLCSDLAPLRAIGGDVPDYLDPLDGPAWRRAIVDYAQPDAPRREAQLMRLKGWRAPTWEEHFARLHAFIDGAALPAETSPA